MKSYNQERDESCFYKIYTIKLKKGYHEETLHSYVKRNIVVCILFLALSNVTLFLLSEFLATVTIPAFRLLDHNSRGIEERYARDPSHHRD